MTNANDKRTLEERLQWIADWSEPDIDLADAGTAREALDKLRAQAAQIESLQRQLAEAQNELGQRDAGDYDVLKAVAKEREACARIMDERAAMYHSKAAKRDPFAEDSMTEYERFTSNAEASEWGAAAIRNRSNG